MNWFVNFFYNNKWFLTACPHVTKIVMCVWCKKDHKFKKRRTDLYLNAIWFKKPHCNENDLIPYTYSIYCIFDT